MVNKPWKNYADILKESAEYVGLRKDKTVKSYKTCWKSFNKIGLNGIELHSIYTLAARPGIGKTLISAELSRSLLELNTDHPFAVLHFQFEMLGRNMGLRELSAATGLNMRYIQSAEDDHMPELSTEDYQKILEYVDSQQKHRNEFVVDMALTVEQMEAVVQDFWKTYKIPFIITVDHTLLVRKDASETSRNATLEKLSIMMTSTKKRFPVTWIVLTQLNREIDSAERQVPGKLTNYPTEADVFGSDYLLQCSDVMAAYNRPAKYNLQIYGPDRFIINNKNLIAMHVLKNRFGETGISWYYADYPVMKFREIPDPIKDTKTTFKAST